MEVVRRVSGPRRWSGEETLQILAASLPAGVQVRDVLPRRELSNWLAYTWHGWCCWAHDGCVAGVAGVRMAEVEPIAHAPQSASEAGLIRIDLPGGMRVNVDAAVDADAPARLLSARG